MQQKCFAKEKGQNLRENKWSETKAIVNDTEKKNSLRTEIKILTNEIKVKNFILGWWKCNFDFEPWILNHYN